MSKVSTSNIIYALRCSSSEGGHCYKREECPYFIKEVLPAEYAKMADEVIADIVEEYMER